MLWDAEVDSVELKMMERDLITNNSVSGWHIVLPFPAQMQCVHCPKDLLTCFNLGTSLQLTKLRIGFDRLR